MDTAARRTPHPQRTQPHPAAYTDLATDPRRAVDAARRRDGGPHLTDAAAGEGGNHCSDFDEAQHVDRRDPPSTLSADASRGQIGGFTLVARLRPRGDVLDSWSWEA
jgi:hypothetical protein